MKTESRQREAVQAIRECLEGVPFLQVAGISLKEGALEPDFQVEVRIKN